ncbi:MAG TPA: hypothetical protein PLG79_10885 [Spirochaetales bacterium]|nr:hypothetical protein [Spirochaetales bacterium]HOV39220.1 hypothetical protein [Spirochaetales bacterium]
MLRKICTGLFGLLFFYSVPLFGEEPASFAGKTPEYVRSESSFSFPTAMREFLEQNHIVAFYGHPHSTKMGILGEFSSLVEMKEELQRYVEEYDAVNGERGAVPAFHIIYATVQPEGELRFLNRKTLQEYIDYAGENGILVFLDHQIGKYPVTDAVKSLLPYLKYPQVHLSLDPEWATEHPGKEIGSVRAEDINDAQQMVQEYLEKEQIPGEKILVVHQFNWKMISQVKKVRSDFPRVVVIHNADGFGTPEEKQKAYAYIREARNMPLKGLKLFLPKSWRKGGFDVPLYSPAEALSFDPEPNLIMYQ